ncbi:MAG TPA: thioesterase family protein, partial [Pseudomonadales bacterium]|nr:thioesterase family protein [Pseudomonadales bacterium]
HTVHFLHTLPWDAGDHFILVAFKNETAADGYLVEDGFLWTETGILLARSRQLAIILEQT